MASLNPEVDRKIRIQTPQPNKKKHEMVGLIFFEKSHLSEPVVEGKAIFVGRPNKDASNIRHLKYLQP